MGGPISLVQELQSDTGAHHSDGQHASELGEIDHLENSIDGMGAMRFTNEEDCGFFGMPFTKILPFEHHVERARSFFQYRLHALYIPSGGKSKFTKRIHILFTSPGTEARGYGERRQISTCLSRIRRFEHELTCSYKGEYICAAFSRTHLEFSPTILSENRTALAFYSRSFILRNLFSNEERKFQKGPPNMARLAQYRTGYHNELVGGERRPCRVTYPGF